ncbi:MAG: hypothetical protein V4813_15050 [Gemmatimonadota bacterium]
MRDDDILSETASLRILRRAATLDAQLGRTVTVEKLRAIAVEAGLSEPSVRLALAELAADGGGGDAESAPWHRRFGGAALRLIGVTAATAATVAVLSPIADLVYAVTGSRTAESHTIVLTLVGGMGIGCLVARRLRTRLGQVLTAGIGLAMLVDVTFEISGFLVNGRAAKFAEIAAALCGVAVGVLLARRSTASHQMSPPAATEADRAETVTRSRRVWRAWFTHRPVVFPTSM